MITSSQGFFKGVTDNGDGTGGSPPTIEQYVMINGDAQNAEVGFDPHAKTFIITQNNAVAAQNGGYICTGVALSGESVTSPAMAFVTRYDPCADASSFTTPLGTELTGAGTDCSTNWTWNLKETNRAV